MIKRIIAKKIQEFSRQYPIVALIGPRQSGKTTLIKTLFSNKPYINLEDLETREYAEKDPKGLLNQYRNGLVIDEAQRVPGLFSMIQVVSDEQKKNGQFILTGSQNFLLLEGISQSLAGRVAILNLLPLSLEELSAGRRSSASLSADQVILKGFYPRLFGQRMDIPAFYVNYIQTYIERDVRLIKNIESLTAFKKFLQLVAARTGQLLNITSLANDAGLNQATVKAWLSVLEASFIIFLLRPHHENYNKQVVRTPKIYFYDTGLLCALLNINEPKQLASHYLRGSIFESMIIAEWYKYRYHRGLQPGAFFWRDKTGHEIDLLIQSAKDLLTVEIKSGQTVSSEFFAGLEYYSRLSGKQLPSYVIYGGGQKQRRSSGTVMSWRDWPGGMSELTDE